ncbi:hypothetical protein [Spiroplasma sp. SV19]|uniref:hypothetical protein n=1 Tax=Spiroplasma sp. SV19 TaxID=2570468 RepID=UPI0024B63C7C|nr:hypothetical protein [Spiroplasma sp. SV19]WHQ36562.1 hypothetical protein E7Y35_01270 [Spiroplasma sp. SV19]
MKKLIKISIKLKSMLLSLIFSTIIIFPNIVIINNVSPYYVNNFEINQNFNQNITSNINQFMYSGEILGYFIYKSSNISENETVEKLEENIIKNKTIIYSMAGNTDNVTMQNTVAFETSLMASIVNISIYGMTSWSEFFAEAYSKWTTTPTEMKNKSWEILNNFFIIVYPKLNQQYFGSRDMTWQNILNFINNYVKTNPIIYDTELAVKPTNAVNLKYDGLFGFQQIISNNAIERNNYTFNAFKTALIEWQNNNDGNSLFSHHIINQYIINYNNNNLSNNLAMMMNDSYTKASDESINKYNTLVSKLRTKYYSSFENLDQTLKQLTNLSQKNTTDVSSIMLKDAIDAMGNHYNWADNKTIAFAEQILNLFNLTSYITDNNFKYYLRAFIFTPDYPIRGQLENTLGVTATYGQVIGNDYFQYFLSVEFSTVIFTGLAFNQNNIGDINLDYKSGWWSSPSIFATLNHEMGHVIDGYHGTEAEYRADLKNNFNNYMKQQKLDNFYNGKIFGYHQIESETTKNLKLILIIIFTVIAFPILIVSIIFLSKKIKKRH